MSAKTPVELRTRNEVKLQQGIDACLKQIGDYESVQRFMRRINITASKYQYANSLKLYLRFLKNEKGITLNPDELITDNLRCVYESAPTDVKTRRKHLDWLDELVNVVMPREGCSEGTRLITAAAVKMFYGEPQTGHLL